MQHICRTEDLNAVFGRLSRSAFRCRFRLRPSESEYLRDKGLEVVRSHARSLIAQRLGAAAPVNDGKQTPFRGHPVFVAQHATATCCRSCLSKWHGIAAGQALSGADQDYIVAVIGRWLATPVVPS